MLDRTQPDPSLNAEGASPALVLDNIALEAPPAQGWQRPLGWLRRAGQFFFALSFSSLTRRVVSLNLAGLVALVASILYLSQFRAGLIDARAQSLLVQFVTGSGKITCNKKGGGTEMIARMPDDCPTDRPCLTAEQIKLIMDWVAAGAPM